MSPAWIDRVVQRVEPEASWDDLPLADEATRALRRIVELVKPDEASLTHGHASALFTGTDAEGKLAAAQVVAGELDLDLYRIDLSLLLGDRLEETERALKRVMDAAERSGGALFFDGGDSMFDKGSEGDPYPDRGGNYLVKQMGRYRGVSFLSVTDRDSVDLALQRRLRPVVDCGR